NNAGIVARFMNEAKSVARLNHEHIAQIYFAGVQDGVPFIVFEYVEGTNIRTLVEENDTLPLAQAMNYLIQLAHALAHAAENGVIHRDVKPSNVLITREGRAKLIDMGLARLIYTENRNDDLTASGVTLGTFDYISPEQARDPRNADIRSDIYSLGCTFFFMLAGHPPFPEGTVLQKLLQHQGDEPPDIRTFQPDAPVEVAQLIQKMMAKDPRHRFQTPALLLEALVRMAKMLGLQPTGQSKLLWMMNHSTRISLLMRHIPWLSALLVLFVIYLPLSVYWGWSDQLEIPHGITKVFDEPESPMESAKTPEDNTENDETASPVISSDMQDNSPAFTLISTSLADASLSGSISGVTAAGAELSPQRLIGSWQNQSDVIIGVVTGTDFRREQQPDNAASTDAASIQNNPLVLCVDPTGAEPESFKTLESALTVASNGDTILLRWNGSEKFKPLVLSDKRLKFVAADGFQPTLRFEPAEKSAVSSSPRTVLSIRSSSLEFRNVGIEFQIRQDEMGLRWTLFDLAGNNYLRFARCNLTIFNAAADNSAYHQDAVFFRNSVQPHVSEPISDAVPEQQQSDGGQLVLDLTDSIVCGEAYCLRNDAPQNIVFSANNTIFALANPFVQNDDTGRNSFAAAKMQIRFNLVTYFGLSCFAKLNKNSAETNPLPLELNMKHSVFLFNLNPLAMFSGKYADGDLAQLFRWTEEQNWFQDIRIAFRFQSDAAAEPGLNDVSLSDWLGKTFPETAEGNSSRPKVDDLVFGGIRKPVSQINWSDLLPSFPQDSSLSAGEILPFGASQPGAFSGAADSMEDVNRIPLETDYGRIIFEKK
ncbi:MAG: serine/threonine protein kinase, partial [Planctomycetaceae bacterium]|nr:serine/threonine protein kinase [Planctomycetaceae bacterium]